MYKLHANKERAVDEIFTERWVAIWIPRGVTYQVCITFCRKSHQSDRVASCLVTPVIIAPELDEDWLGAYPDKAAELMTWSHMNELRVEQALSG